MVYRNYSTLSVRIFQKIHEHLQKVPSVWAIYNDLSRRGHPKKMVGEQ